MNKQITVFESAVQRLDMVLAMADEHCVRIHEKDIRTAFIIRHCRNIYHLADDALALAHSKRLGSIYLFARPALESLFKLAAAVSNKTFAAEKVVGELLEEREKLGFWRKESNASFQSILDACVQVCDDYAADLRTRYNVTGDKKWRVWEVACQGRLKPEYVKAYFIGSKHVHSMLSALVDRELGQTYLPEAIYSFTTTITSACVLVMVHFRLDTEISEDALKIVEKALAARNEESGHLGVV
jgi:hypothetical protein